MSEETEKKRSSGRASGKKRKQNNKKKRTGKKSLLAVILVFMAIVLAAVVEVTGVFSADHSETFDVRRGDGTKLVARHLDEQGLIRSSLLFRVVSRVSGADGEWNYGTHKIKAKSSYGEIIDELTSPQPASVKITFPEGKQVVQMANILAEKGICKKQEFMDACTDKNYDQWEFLKDVPTEKRIGGLEGYLFPDTYYFDKHTDPDEVIRTMLKRFEEKVYTDEERKKAEKMGFSIDEIVILASMAESEAVTKADRRTVSGVFLNRLEKGDKLQSCVTVEYAKRMKKTIISLEDTKFDSPYNTYMYAGLPYGPICCPGMESIDAVLYNEDNDYYYFQSDQDGRLHFAKTYQEHVKIQKEVQKDWEVKVTKIE